MTLKIMSNPRFLDLRDAGLRHNIAEVRRLVNRGLDINCRDSMGYSILHYLVGEYILNHQIITTLVQMGADINATAITGQTPLHCILHPNNRQLLLKEAIRTPKKCHVQSIIRPVKLETAEDIADYLQLWAVEVITKLGANVDAACDYEITSLHRAVRLGCTTAVKVLLRLGVSANVKMSTNVTALHYAVSKGLNKVCCKLGELGADVNAHSVSGAKPIHEAVRFKKLDIVQVLLQYKADINDDVTEHQPLFTALSFDRYEIAEHLIHYGADVNATLCIYSAVHQCIEHGDVDILEYIGSHVAKPILPRIESTLLGIAVEKSVEWVEFFMKNGADVNVRFDRHVSPLSLAIKQKSKDVVRALVKSGCDPDAPDIEGWTALHLALDQNRLNVLELLLKNGGDANIKIARNIRPIHQAVSSRNIEMVKVLGNLGADMNVGKDMLTLLSFYLSIKCSWLERDDRPTKMLLQFGADVNSKSTLEVRPLHDAVSFSDLEMVKLLVEQGADVNLNRLVDITPLSFCVHLDNLNEIKHLVEQGADINMPITSSLPLYDAIRENRGAIANLLSVDCGANCHIRRDTTVPLEQAILFGRMDMFELLVTYGADINIKVKKRIILLADIDNMLDEYNPDAESQYTFYNSSRYMYDEVCLLYVAVRCNNADAVEKLLERGINMTGQKSVYIDDDSDLLCMCSSDTPFSRGCQMGHIGIARTLIIHELDFIRADQFGTLPMSLLPLLECVDYGAFQEVDTGKPLLEESKAVSTTGCKDMQVVLDTPGLGNAERIKKVRLPDVLECVTNSFSLIAKHSKGLQNIEISCIGSAGEGTKVDLPNEMDFIFKIHMTKDQELAAEMAKNGFVRIDEQRLQELDTENNTSPFVESSSQISHFEFYACFVEAYQRCRSQIDDRVTFRLDSNQYITATARKACSMVWVIWRDGDVSLDISVDLVPCLVVNDWPEGACERTWLMKNEDLRKKGYVLVPKPPHPDSEVAMEYSKHELWTLWKISFPHLETEHMQRLDQRIKDVYITAKSLRNPDVSRILIVDEGPFPKNVDKYISSYMLKMIFFKNVEYFLSADLGLEEMVCIVYDDLYECLKRGFIPTFFLPEVDALCGRKVDYPKMTKVAVLMKQFVKALKGRSAMRHNTAKPAEEDDIGHSKSVYRTYKI